MRHECVGNSYSYVQIFVFARRLKPRLEGHETRLPGFDYGSNRFPLKENNWPEVKSAEADFVPFQPRLQSPGKSDHFEWRSSRARACNAGPAAQRSRGRSTMPGSNAGRAPTKSVTTQPARSAIISPPERCSVPGRS